MAQAGIIWGLAGALLLVAPACSVRKMAVNRLGDALAQSGDTFARDDDPELIKQAAPFSLKLMESLLAESPRHPGLLLAAAKGFTQYAYAYVQQEADEKQDVDLAAATAAQARARRLYLRARDYGLRGLEVEQPGLVQSLRAGPATAALAGVRRSEVPLLYWTAVSWAAAIALSKDQPETVADLPLVEALVDRALALDEAFGAGALPSFLIAFESARKSVPGDPLPRVERHFARACQLSQNQLAGPFVAYAETVCIQRQDAAGFRQKLAQALAIDADAQPANRLENLIMQRRARWLLGRVDELFLLLEENQNPGQ